jgi:hypothetical protein
MGVLLEFVFLFPPFIAYCSSGTTFSFSWLPVCLLVVVVGCLRRFSIYYFQLWLMYAVLVMIVLCGP